MTCYHKQLLLRVNCSLVSSFVVADVFTTEVDGTIVSPDTLVAFALQALESSGGAPQAPSRGHLPATFGLYVRSRSQR